MHLHYASSELAPAHLDPSLLTLVALELAPPLSSSSAPCCPLDFTGHWRVMWKNEQKFSATWHLKRRPHQHPAKMTGPHSAKGRGQFGHSSA